MSRYVLGLRKASGQTDEAVCYRTAALTVAKFDDWQANGDAVIIILKAGKPITAKMLRRDAENERKM